MHVGKAEFVTVKYTRGFLYPVWLYFLWGGINRFSQALKKKKKWVNAELHYNLILKSVIQNKKLCLFQARPCHTPPGGHLTPQWGI